MAVEYISKITQNVYRITTHLGLYILGRIGPIDKSSFLSYIGLIGKF
jgi:hypothetical protein